MSVADNCNDSTLIGIYLVVSYGIDMDQRACFHDMRV